MVSLVVNQMTLVAQPTMPLNNCEVKEGGGEVKVRDLKHPSCHQDYQLFNGDGVRPVPNKEYRQTYYSAR